MTQEELDRLVLALTPEDLGQLATAVAQKESKKNDPSDGLERLALSLSRKILLLQKEILSVDEVAEYTGLSRSYIYKLTSARAIPHFKPTGKMCFFKRKDLDAWMLSNPVASQEEIGYLANDYLLSHPMKY